MSLRNICRYGLYVPELDTKEEFGPGSFGPGLFTPKWYIKISHAVVHGGRDSMRFMKVCEAKLQDVVTDPLQRL